MLKLVLFCSLLHAASTVTCFNGCLNVPNCPVQGPPCSDAYCFYVKQIGLQYSQASQVIHGCSVVPFIVYEQNMPAYDLLNTCSSIVVDNISYNIKICNSSDYCSSDCQNPIPYYPPQLTTYQPWSSWATTTSSAQFTALFLPFFLVPLLL
ncbi:hypothetical protein FO519_000416 [Halicephalobus sp. NKZ332]|nr:hypothetical protein FO519_000416 [Halicephalobus sp. NKZ332]